MVRKPSESQHARTIAKHETIATKASSRTKTVKTTITTTIVIITIISIIVAVWLMLYLHDIDMLFLRRISSSWAEETVNYAQWYKLMNGTVSTHEQFEVQMKVVIDKAVIAVIEWH